ncbi:MAG TPA: response regulator transcription factor [Terriglobales bacterium]|nr:response regulator transcription factor [Terriglobales bacterium]
MKILVVDDEPQILRVLRRGLEDKGYEVATASDGVAALDTLKSTKVDLLITDLRMPDLNGLQLCTEVRKNSKLPILVLSVKGEEATKVEALDAGADDYVTKPFGMDELLARIRALSRRTHEEEPSGEPIKVGDFEVNPDQRQVLVRGQEIRLTPKEYELIIFFLANRGKVNTHRSILRAVWGENSQEQPEYLRVFVGQLRKKIEVDPSHPRYIKTEPWVGYRFNPEL